MTTATEKLSATDLEFGKGIAPSTIFTADNLDVLRLMKSECIDLIYLDPPLNAAVPSNPFNAERPIVKEIWPMGLVREEWLTDIGKPVLDHIIEGARLAHGEPIRAYLAYMGIRLIEMHRVLKETGSIYLHCDPSVSHYLKAAMDSIFGFRNFINEVIWNYRRPISGGATRMKNVTAHDTLLVYAKSYGKHTYNVQRLEYPVRYGRIRSSSAGLGIGSSYPYKGSGNGAPDYYRSVPLPDVWSDLRPLLSYRPDKSRQESTGYPTQKPRALLERIIGLSTNQDDVVLDPFCGCATACVAAEGMTTVLTDRESPSLQPVPRRWIGVDIDPNAYEVVLNRFKDELGLEEHGGQIRTHAGEIQHRTIKYDQKGGQPQNPVGGDVPERTDLVVEKSG